MLNLSDAQLYLLLEMHGCASETLDRDDMRAASPDLTAEEIAGLVQRQFLCITGHGRYALTNKAQHELFHCFRTMHTVLKDIAYHAHKQSNGRIFDLANKALNWKGMDRNGN